MIGGDNLAVILGIEPRRECGRSRQIAEHNRQLPALGFGSNRRSGGWGRRRRRSQILECAQYSLAVAEQHAELFEISLGQIGQAFGIDRVVAKGQFVLLQPKAAQPNTDIQGIPAFGRRDFSMRYYREPGIRWAMKSVSEKPKGAC